MPKAPRGGLRVEPSDGAPSTSGRSGPGLVAVPNGSDGGRPAPSAFAAVSLSGERLQFRRVSRGLWDAALPRGVDGIL